MEEKKAKKISVSVILLILAIIALVVMGIFIYKLELQAEVDDLNNTVSDLQRKIDKISETLSTNNSNSIQENTTNSSTEISNSAVKENNYDDIVLDGYYTFPATDIGWDFTKDGRVAFVHSNFAIEQPF